MEDKKPSDIEKAIAEFMAKMKPVTPEMMGEEDEFKLTIDTWGERGNIYRKILNVH